MTITKPTDDELIDRAARLAQGDSIDRFRRSELNVLLELDVIEADAATQAVALGAYAGIWDELVEDAERRP